VKKGNYGEKRGKGPTSVAETPNSRRGGRGKKKPLGKRAVPIALASFLRKEGRGEKKGKGYKGRKRGQHKQDDYDYNPEGGGERIRRKKRKEKKQKSLELITKYTFFHFGIGGKRKERIGRGKDRSGAS